MNEVFAGSMIQSWKYDGEYAVYDYANEADHILDTESWGIGLFAVLNRAGELVGELTIEFFDENDEYIEPMNINPAKLRFAELWIGFGLRPNLTGLGLGRDFAAQCIDFAVEKHAYQGEFVRLGVATFNKWAIKVYESLGFQVFNQMMSQIDGKEFKVVHMKKRLVEAL